MKGQILDALQLAKFDKQVYGGNLWEYGGNVREYGGNLRTSLTRLFLKPDPPQKPEKIIYPSEFVVHVYLSTFLGTPHHNIRHVFVYKYRFFCPAWHLFLCFEMWRFLFEWGGPGGE